MSEENENMKIYEATRTVPNEALKKIGGGRLKGMSDINPMWRIKLLTELFGICGIGWKIEIVDQRLEQGSADQIACFVTINLYIKVDGEWSDPIPGMGGSAFVTKESSGLYTSDECFKMAYTDAISVACKSLGFAADVYYANDRTKYTKETVEEVIEDEKAIERDSKLNNIITKWQVLSGEKDNKKGRESFAKWLDEKQYSIETITVKQLEGIESMFAKKLNEKAQEKKESAKSA
jgi:hypothetical protein